MRRLPLPSIASALGTVSCALVAGPPSPPLPQSSLVMMPVVVAGPLPATDVMTPVLAATRRMRWLSLSAMNRSPAALSAKPVGVVRLALVAGPPSPRRPVAPVPATVVMTPVPASIRRTRLLAESVKSRLPPPSTSIALGSDDSPALVAGSPSPLKPSTPVPASVEMSPVLLVTMRTRLASSASSRLPRASSARAQGERTVAFTAPPPSPWKPRVPLPTSVVTAPVPAASCTTR